MGDLVKAAAGPAFALLGGSPRTKLCRSASNQSGERWTVLRNLS